MLRYRFRLYPDVLQRRALARAFGCARVVYNDAVTARETAHRNGEPYPTARELSRRLITQAKQTPERVWLAEVSAVVLQQALADAELAYRNWFDSVSGKRKGPRMGQPRFRSRKARCQAVRFTRNARFAVTDTGRLRLPKVGDVQVRWSRTLPSDPSSVTITLDAAGRYHASFVVERPAEPLTPTARAVYVEDLAVAGLARTRLAKSVHDAGWSTFIAMLEYKAAQHGRTFARVGRWQPTSQTCSMCGVKDGPKPLGVRGWTCAACDAVHDRDVNAARNILAAGRAVTACGPDVGRRSAGAVGDEAGTHEVAA